ncbi:MAG: InlB B-repeat-containing protein, partial [Propionibacteriaceae bacterium]|nr:InlB B-repeat-containing protein [Propionibacteriaceae bacterium]
DALGEIVPVIMQWYNQLPPNKKYLLAGVVLGMELSTEMNAFYYHSAMNIPKGDPRYYNGNDYANENGSSQGFASYADYDQAMGLSSGGAKGNTVRLGYAAAQTLRAQGHDIDKTLAANGAITGETIDYILNDYINFLISESIQYGIAPNKLITHAYPPPFEPIAYKDITFNGAWWGSFSHVRSNQPKVEGVVAGFTAPIVSYQSSINLDRQTKTILGNRVEMEGIGDRPWAAIETHLWALLDARDGETPAERASRLDYLKNKLPSQLAGIYDHGNCRHVNLKNWEQLKTSPESLVAIRYALNSARSSYKVTYDFGTNGGSSATAGSAVVVPGAAVSLAVTASKAGWVFVGWNTDKDATVGLTSLSMPGSDVTLFAIFKKTLTVTLKDYSGSAPVTRTVSTTIFNRATSGTVTLPAVNTYAGWWAARGWASALSANPTVVGSTYSVSGDVTLYGVYQRTFTHTFDAAGGSSTPASLSSVQYVSSYAIDQILSSSITLPAGPVRSGWAFDGWVSNAPPNWRYAAGVEVTPYTNTTFTAQWRTTS